MDNFNDQKIIDGFQRELFSIIEEDSIGRAYKFFYYLEKILEMPIIRETLKDYSLLHYQKMIAEAKFIALPWLSKKEVYKLLNDHFHYSFKIEGYDLWRKIKEFLTELNSLEERDNIKKDIRKILLKNEALITNNNIKLGAKEVVPSINNWFNDFLNQFGEEGFSDQIKLSEYLSNSNNIKNLSEEERKKVNILFNLYKKLKFSSFTKEGLEEDITIIKPDRELGFIKQGRYEKVDNKIVELSKKMASAYNIRYLASQYPPNSLERKAIEEEIAKFDR